MKQIKLESKTRAEIGRKVNAGRKNGMIPAVVYGKGIVSENIWVNNLDFRRLLKKFGESVIINLDIEGKNGRNVIIQEIQKNPVSGSYAHVDFFQVNMAEKIEAEVHLEYIGESAAVREAGGILVKSLDKLKIKCLPADLPSHIDVDISSIKTFEDHIFVKDLKIGDKVEVDLDPDTVVALVTPPRSEEELSKLEEKVEVDVTKVEGVVKAEPAAGEEVKEENK